MEKAPTVERPSAVLAWRIFGFAAALSVAFVVLHPVAAAFFPKRWAWRFNLDKEGNFPTWCAASLLLTIGIVSLFIHLLRPSPTPGRSMFASAVNRYFWLGFGLTYVFLSADESAQVHEFGDNLHFGRWFYYYAAPAFLFAVLSVYYAAWLRRRDGWLRSWMVSGLAVSALGAFGCEIADHVFMLWRSRYAGLELMTEEGLDMVGSSLVLAGCAFELQRLREQSRGRQARGAMAPPSEV